MKVLMKFLFITYSNYLSMAIEIDFYTNVIYYNALISSNNLPIDSFSFLGR